MAYRVNIKRFEDLPDEAFTWITNVVGAPFKRLPAFEGVLMSGPGWTIKTEVIEHTISDDACNTTDPLMKYIFQSNLCKEICLPTIQYYAEFEEEIYALQFKLMI
jgi:hypothetical protein